MLWINAFQYARIKVMKNRFEKFRKGVKKLRKVALIAGAVVGPVVATHGQVKEPTIKQEVSPFLFKLKAQGIVPKDMTEKEFQNVKVNDPEKFKKWTNLYVEAIGAITPKEAEEKYGNKLEIIKSEIYGITLTEVDSDTISLPLNNFDFDKWFKEQWQLVKDGKLKLGSKVTAPNGKTYIISLDLDPNKTLKRQSPKTKRLNSPIVQKTELTNIKNQEDKTFVLVKDF